MDVAVLGPVRASTDGIDHPLGGAKQCVLLAHLVIARGRPVSAQRLISELWEDAPPRDPTHALQARISRLRSSLPIDIGLVDGGYRLEPASIQTDAARFESLYEEGQWLLTDGMLAQAGECLHTALELWDGEAFSGLLNSTVLRAESARLEELRMAALADRIDVDLALGRHAAVVAELHAIVEEWPYAERHWGQLMTALYSDDRPKEALNVFATARAVFSDGLGVEPSAELGRIHVGILRGHTPESLLRLAPPAPERPAVATPLADGAHIDRLTSNHPDTLVQLLRDKGTLLLTGTAGIGKTHLLRAVSAHFEAQRFAAKVLSASSLSYSVPLGVFAGVDGATASEWTSPAGLIDQFTRHRSRTVLLVDNVAQLDEASLFVVAHLIRTAKIPTILTARDLVEAPGEIRSMYDSGDLTEVGVQSLTDADADELVAQLVGGPLTPYARARMFAAAQGNPLHLREVITASLDDGRLVRDGPAWELRGDPASTPRLTQLVGERFDGLSEVGIEGAARVAIAGEYPAAVLGDKVRRELARAGVVEYSSEGWLRLSHPLDAEVLRSRCPAALWSDLTHEVLQALQGDATANRPVARRRAHILALDLDHRIDPKATLEVAAYALGTFDAQLALRAAQAVVAQEPKCAEAHRTAGVAASSLGLFDLAGESFQAAADCSVTVTDTTELALARARHTGIGLHDAAGALAILQAALQTVDDPDAADHLRRDCVRWAVLAGQSAEQVTALEASPDVMATMGLITAGMTGVITGPLEDAQAALVRLHQVPDEVIGRVPGGAALLELTEIMTISNSGDMVASRDRLNRAISYADLTGAESIGAWEYALGFSELMSGDAQRAYDLAVLASTHLEWRDFSGLLPAARALAGAAAHATGRVALASEHFDTVPTTAESDPKVVMLRGWAEAWQQNSTTREGGASRTLLDTARWLLAAQHNYFAAMLAHCAVRIGHDATEAVEIIEQARSIAGGGLLAIFSRHGAATVAGDAVALDEVARDARELGMATTAADTWLLLTRTSQSGRAAHLRHDRQQLLLDELCSAVPAMALWAHAEPVVHSANLG